MTEVKPIQSIGIILDGNRRWAKERGLPTLAGHKEGVEAIRRLVKEIPHFKEKYGLEYATLYTFSTENWNRDEKEVGYLMELLRIEFKALAEKFDKDNVCVQIIGQRDRFADDIQELFDEIEEKTKDNTDFTVVFALSYGGRPEIIEAVNKAIKEGKEVSEESFSTLLWSADIPDPDIIIRTSGEKRLSNFLTWRSVYSELFFIDKHWPAFTADDLKEIFEEYQERERRHGK